MKKILILSPFFYPEPISTGKYNTEFANHLANNSFDVSVLCCHPIYPRWIVEKTDKKLKNIKIKRGGAFLKFPNNKYVRRAILELWFFLFILINLRELFKQDIIIAVLPPSLFMTTFIFLPKKIKKIGIVHDLQNIHLGKKTSLFKNIINKLIYFIERSAFKRCENLIYLSNEMLEYATNEYKLHDKKSDVLYPFITLDSFSNNRNLDYNFSDKNFNIVYSGALGEKQNPDALYEIALSVIKKAKEARFIFFSEGSNFQKLKKNDEGHKNNAMNSVLKTLVVAIGKDSTGAMKARSDLQRLLKKYPNEVPTALIGIVREKLKKNGLGIILAIQLSATMIGLLLSIIPIPGLAIIGEAVAVAANMGTDLLVAVGPEQIIALLKNGSQQALEAFTKSMVPLIEGISGAFCCNSSGSKKNMEKFGKIMEHLIELENIDNKEEAKTKIEAYIKEIQGVMSKPVPGVDMTALDKLIKKYQAAKDKEKGKTTDPKPKPKSGGKRRKTRKRRKRKTKKRRRKRRKRRKTNKYRNKFTRRY